MTATRPRGVSEAQLERLGVVHRVCASARFGFSQQEPCDDVDEVRAQAAKAQMRLFEGIVPPDKIIDYLALMGDAVDNVPANIAPDRHRLLLGYFPSEIP